jgi:hypothetical protein
VETVVTKRGIPIAFSGTASQRVALHLSAAPDLFVEPSMPVPQRDALRAKITAAEGQVSAVYGSVLVHPTFVACSTTACLHRFGRRSGRGITFRSIVLLSPDGLTTPIVAHEWSHAELAKRLGWSGHALRANVRETAPPGSLV